MLLKYLLNLWLLFVAFHLSQGEDFHNEVCYIKGDSGSEMCQLQLNKTRKGECCSASMSNLTIRVYHKYDGNCDNKTKCIGNTFTGCCYQDTKIDVSEKYLSRIEDVFKSTKCFGIQKESNLLQDMPQTEGIYFIRVSYTCTKSSKTEQGNTAETSGKTSETGGKTTKIKEKITGTTEKTKETGGKTKETREKIAGSTRKTTETAERLPTEEDRVDGHRHGHGGGRDIALAVSIPVTVAVVAIAVVVVCYMYLRRRTVYNGGNTSCAESNAAIEPSCSNPLPPVNAPPQYYRLHHRPDSEHNAEIPADKDSDAQAQQETDRDMKSTVNLKTLPTLRDSAHGCGAEKSTVENGAYDHIGSDLAPTRGLEGNVYDVAGDTSKAHGHGPNNAKGYVGVSSQFGGASSDNGQKVTVGTEINDDHDGVEHNYFVLEKQVNNAKRHIDMDVTGHSIGDSDSGGGNNPIDSAVEITEPGISSQREAVSSDVGQEVKGQAIRGEAEINDDHDGVEPNYFVLEKQVNTANSLVEKDENKPMDNAGVEAEAGVLPKLRSVSPDDGKEVIDQTVRNGAEINDDHVVVEHNYIVLEKQ